MKTINIRGKEYVTVNERLKEFRNNFKDYSLITEIVELGADYATIKASVIDDKGILRATGFAREVVAKSPINKYAFLENCETSAIGRALGNFGIGIDEAICTADELLVKLAQDDKSQEAEEFKKDATAEKRALTNEVKKGAEKAPAPIKSLSERIKGAKAFLEENNTAEKYAKQPARARDRLDALIEEAEKVPEYKKDAEALKICVLALKPSIDDEIIY